MTKQLAVVLAKYPRIAIAGGPHTGKSTLCRKLVHETDRKVLHTDDLMHLGWEAQPHAIIAKLAGESAFLVEGVQVGRAIRKGLVVDCVIWMQGTFGAPLTPGQMSMTKGCTKIFAEVKAAHPNIPVIVISNGPNGAQLEAV